MKNDLTVSLATSDKSDKGSYFQDWSEDSEYDLEFNESIGSSQQKNESKEQKGFKKFRNILSIVRSHFVMLKKWK